MCSKKRHNLFRTVTFRLTLWYAATFGLLSLVVFMVVYIVLISNLGKRTDDELLSKAKEFKELYETHGIQALESEYHREAESRGIKRVFFRLLSPQKEVLVTSDLNSWSGLDTVQIHPPQPADGKTEFETISVPGYGHKVRVALGRTNDGRIIQLGATLQDNDALMEKYRESFGTALVLMLLCGGVVGWFMARRAMSGVERVTQTAVRIGQGDLDRRVPLRNEGQEIDDLALAFNDMLERIQALVKELKEVTDNIGHDLRSPITRIRGIAETTLMGEQSLDAYREMAAAVVEESDRLVQMINTMLEIAHTDSGVAELSKTAVDVREIVEEARELFSPVAEDKNIRLETDIPPEPLTVLGDVAKLQRVIANLTDNAIKYTSSGGKVAVSVKPAAAHAIIHVADTGIGIDEGEMPRIFDRFYRGDKSRSTPGAGLGLSLALAIVRAHGGDITVTSTPSEGSTFTVVLPRASASR